ncbi:hypothetical protein H0I76_04660 [Limibaculum sp. M0105]|uniref:Neurotransmitter-gated ion-channel ligand-binding domain-containing protein n=1 Tax=Thermohalobaculum xanthum TaxID=2753746 RepID=A0A8J7M5B5_9RHOB|nr:hypothetical protein [Thermohalobaculum xanthum]MBK0398470.1 hypothetical protein [Thermohalobaculum xanthum]
MSRTRNRHPGVLYIAFLMLAAVCCPILSVPAQTPGTAPISEEPTPAADHTTIERPTTWGEPTEVQLRTYVIDVDAIDSANQRFSASVFLVARWTDHSLKHSGPGPKIMPATSVWTPRLAIVNQQQGWSAFPPYAEVEPDGTVTMRQKVWAWFSQPLDLRDFPFDRQTLQIHVVAAGLLRTEVALVALVEAHGRQSAISETFSLPDFEVLDWKVEPREFLAFKGEAGTAGFIMEIFTQRTPQYYVFKLIVPLCLIVAMSWAPLWIPSSETGARIGIAATAFLTLVAYLFATANLLPRVPYFTRMDRFILLSTLLVFCSLAQTIAVISLRQYLGAARCQSFQKVSRIVYPVLLTLIIYVSFVI